MADGEVEEEEQKQVIEGKEGNESEQEDVALLINLYED